MSRLAGESPRWGLGLDSARSDDIIGFQRDARLRLEVAAGIILPP
jgi:hypothetical protein